MITKRRWHFAFIHKFCTKIGYYHRWMVNCIKLFTLTNHPSSSWNPLSMKQNINISDGMDNGNSIEMDRNTNNWYWLSGLTCRTWIVKLVKPNSLHNIQHIASRIICFVYLERFNADNLIIYEEERSKQIWAVLALLNINFLTTEKLTVHTAKVVRAAQPGFTELGEEGKGNSILQFLPYLPHYLHRTFLLQSNKFPNFVTKHIYIQENENILNYKGCVCVSQNVI